MPIQNACFMAKAKQKTDLFFFLSLTLPYKFSHMPAHQYYCSLQDIMLGVLTFLHATLHHYTLVLPYTPLFPLLFYLNNCKENYSFVTVKTSLLYIIILFAFFCFFLPLLFLLFSYVRKSQF